VRVRWFTRVGIGVAVGGAIAIGPLGPAAAGDWFDFFSSGSKPHSPTEVPSVRAYADPSAPVPRDNHPLPSQLSGVPSVAYCVRLCDGRYFPIALGSGGNPGQVCSNLCPASLTKIFYGAQIEHAKASDGRRYADLENAFVYRQRLVDNCTCNGRDAFGTAPLSAANDPTLRAGDMVATADGLTRFSGRSRNVAKFTPVDVNLSTLSRR
jgi:hypothetical protein